MNEFELPPSPPDRGPDPAGGRPGSEEQGGGDLGGGRPRPRRRRTLARTLAGAVLAAALAATGIAIYTIRAGGSSSPGAVGLAGSSAPVNVVQATQPAPPASASAITARVDPGLVNVTVANRSTGTAGEATGMVLTPSGVVLTNNHVIQGATQISATDVGNGKTYSASVVGYDRTGDVAVIQLHGARGLQTVPLGDSSTVAVSGKVLALGNAGGGGGTPRVAQGSVTALGQTITASDIGGGNAERLAGLIQTDAAVLPGDSGGPLVNDGGQVVGMDAAASSADTPFIAQASAPQAFAIPIDTAIAIAKQIEAGTSSATVHVGPTGFLGVEVVPTSQLGGGFSNEDRSQTQGALVGGTLPGYPAARIGLAQGDVIISVDGQAVGTPAELTDLLAAHHPGDAVQLQWTDTSGQTHTAAVQLASGPPA